MTRALATLLVVDIAYRLALRATIRQRLGLAPMRGFGPILPPKS